MVPNFPKHLIALVVALASVGPAVAQEVSTAVATPVTAAVNLDDGYVVGVGDVVEITVLGRDEFRPRVQVQVDGTIQLPYLNSIQAANKTVLQLRNYVQQMLKAGGYYANPAVSVMVVTNASRYAIVLGEVASPGLVPLDRALRVSEVLARVGGTRSIGADAIILTRPNGEAISLRLADVAAGTAETDPVVNPGDKIYVSPPKQFYIYGQVNSPGTYPIDSGMDLRKALARGGGLTQLGTERGVKIYRDGERVKDFDPSQPIQPGDVVVVGERFF